MNVFYCVLICALIACNSITSGNKMSHLDILRIQQLGLLDKDEKIVVFYSEHKNSVAGNFFSNKRLASYWKDEKDPGKNKLNTAYYSDIVAIDTVSYAGLTYCPYMMVTKNDSTRFKVCFDGKKEEIRKVFIQALDLWKAKRAKYK